MLPLISENTYLPTPLKFFYFELINKSAEATLEFPPYPIFQRVPPEVFSAWVRPDLTFLLLFPYSMTGLLFSS
ncbi:hypothetical protein K435DRAFT_438681 [Dendrothele bispora CBS 962.96]|uniref:Uncharacterized protein n=1 Tax=Dendrothele bispora (strain CBS 962.96) TaxID=1314807 RepID=A0A4S8L330_DENBC|nr:hypothetical protein K435DRAFT_438681 [Dendrothele bispora CBS 962.96]